MGGQKNLCDGCNGRCCRLLVEISTYDIGRILTHLGEEDQSKKFINIVPALGNEFGFRTMDGMVRFVMDRNFDGSCAFFSRNGEYHCTINDHKPAICISYPYQFKGKKVVARNDVGCPSKGKWMVTAAQEKIMNENEDEWDNYADIIEEWNGRAKGDESAEDFMMFAFREMELLSNPLGRSFRKIRNWIRRKIGSK